MLNRRDIDPTDETGTTMVELLVGMAMGMIVLVGLTMTLIVVLHGNARVDARVEATDNARIAVTRIVEELHSACIAHTVAPVREGSTPNELIFWRAPGGQGSESEPTPVQTVIAYSSGTLTQTDYPAKAGTGPAWQFYEEPGKAEVRQLLTNVAPAAQINGVPTGGMFVYSHYVGDGTEPLPMTSGQLSALEAEQVILVNVALSAGPRSSPVADAGAAATIQDSATLRLTPPSSTGTEAQPCD